MFFQKTGNCEYSVSYSVNIGDSFDEFGRPVVFDLLKPSKENLLEKKGVELPIKIFSTKISGLRAIVKYLIEVKSLSFSQIAVLLGRDPRTIWSTYNAVKTQKRFTAELFLNKGFFVNTEVFRNSNLSILECISLSLKEKSLNLNEIASLLNKSPKTIWTVLSRAQKKLNSQKSSHQKSGGVQK
ncbi:MAG TPA: hypothetical protein PLX15_01510 [Candidatus Woesearchaeota archaeon]|nr:hypothetical protein [Candidatus Woesearchaeota archaeon]